MKLNLKAQPRLSSSVAAVLESLNGVALATKVHSLPWLFDFLYPILQQVWHRGLDQSRIQIAVLNHLLVRSLVHSHRSLAPLTHGIANGYLFCFFLFWPIVYGCDTVRNLRRCGQHCVCAWSLTTGQPCVRVLLID